MSTSTGAYTFAMATTTIVFQRLKSGYQNEALPS